MNINLSYVQTGNRYLAHLTCFSGTCPSKRIVKTMNTSTNNTTITKAQSHAILIRTNGRGGSRPKTSKKIEIYKTLLSLNSDEVRSLLFSIGLKIKPSSLLNTSLFLVFLMHSSVVFLIFLFLLNLGVSLEIKVLICLAFTFSSTIIASKALENRNELTTFHGRLAISLLIFQDILALIVLLLTNDTSWTPSALYLLALPLLIPILKILLENLIQVKNWSWLLQSY